MDYVSIINEENKLNTQLKVLEEKYSAEVLLISTRLAELSQHKEDFMSGNDVLAFAREYIDVHGCPLNLLIHFSTYTENLKNELMKDYKQFLTHDLELQDNAYGGDTTKYTDFVKKGHSINYHPNLFSIGFSKEMPVQYFNELAMELDRVTIQPITKEKQVYESRLFQPFSCFSNIPPVLEYKIKTENYDYTKLFKLLNFPTEVNFNDLYNSAEGMYKLIGDSYVFHTYYGGKWHNMSDEYQEFLTNGF